MSDSTSPDEQPRYSTCDNVSDRCPVEATIYGDYFTIEACIALVAAYAILMASQAYLTWRSRTWSFSGWLATGCFLELVGYAARIVLYYNPWDYTAFVIQLVMLILGPTFVAASISITFKHLILWYGPEWSFIKPKLLPFIMVGTDFFSIVIQATGGVISAMANGGDDDKTMSDLGANLLVAGTAFQAGNMLFCGGIMVLYWVRRSKSLKNTNGRSKAMPKGFASSDVSMTTLSYEGGVVEQEPMVSSTDPRASASGTERHLTDLFVKAIIFAYITIIIRCIYRVPEMQQGWASNLMQNESLFLILDGAMILLAVFALCVFHPANFFTFMCKSKHTQKYKTLGSRNDNEV